jgi:hypothetical protein
VFAPTCVQGAVCSLVPCSTASSPTVFPTSALAGTFLLRTSQIPGQLAVSYCEQDAGKRVMRNCLVFSCGLVRPCTSPHQDARYVLLLRSFSSLSVP